MRAAILNPGHGRATDWRSTRQFNKGLGRKAHQTGQNPVRDASEEGSALQPGEGISPFLNQQANHMPARARLGNHKRIKKPAPPQGGAGLARKPTRIFTVLSNNSSA